MLRTLFIRKRNWSTLFLPRKTRKTRKRQRVFVFFVSFVVEKDFRTSFEHMFYRAESVNWQMKDALFRI